jgi:ubiquitin-like protein Nedd8
MREIYARFFSSDPIESAPRQPNRAQRAGLTEKPVVISVKTLTGKTRKLSVTNLTAIHSVKELLHHMTGISPDKQGLIYAGKRMVDERTVAEYNIEEGDVIHLVVPLC